ncbi:zf-BED domain-containing protein/DUF659 domain-containing protein/Dimer_Tnp_hAT domain-containing protein [Cephalotus follicularis]|uniref:Zf-BED domain-containing protein/DUF659 domain-containing protein/Dimer_Tnp_hAT domain-containing protein n=1 Tax=Cephalotus follicularis TaxID=3775 RepID=A0A1Q3CEG7_CEPFO|nr:zf-BED domain-containing protein/DUF659 domain-containing protein/Dimer_Tnp_hAT domain-containing protein [Cephalotus follicularis]
MVESMARIHSSGFVDPGWEHAVALDEKKKKVKCNYCGKIVSGGIYRLKQHLARVSGEVTYCDKAPEVVYVKMKEILEGSRSIKKSRQFEDDGQAYVNFRSNVDEEAEVDYRSKGKESMVSRNVVRNSIPLRSFGHVDPGWEHGVAQDDRKKKVKCNYCQKIVSGGINRFKQHLARIPGEVAPCKFAPEDVYYKIKENMKWHRTGRRNRQPDSTDISPYHRKPDTEDGQEEDALLLVRKERPKIGEKRLGKDMRRSFHVTHPASGSEPILKRSKLDSAFLKTPKSRRTPLSGAQQKVKSGSDGRSHREVFSAICKFFYHAGVPFQAANSHYFQRMLELVGQYGQGLTSPSSQLISGRFLQEEIAITKKHLVEYKTSWANTGCSILADSWTDTEGRTLINFLVSCTRGVYFVSSVDATDVLDDALKLFKLLDKVVEEFGEENVVQVITKNVPNYKAAGKMLEEKRKRLFWTPCATDSIDQMLEDFLKLKCIGRCMQKAQKITKFIYNRVWLLNLMQKEFSQGQELLRPSVTRSASSFATLQNMLDHRSGLRRMFLSNRWISSRFSKSNEGKEVEKIVLSVSFWNEVQYVSKAMDPVMQVLVKVYSGESLSMPHVYKDMYSAKLTIKSIHGDNPRKYGPFWSVIDKHWNSLYHHPVHTAAYFLNPSYRYRPDFIEHSEVLRGLNECIVRLEPDNARRISASTQISDYSYSKADFGTELAMTTRTEIDPAAWWQQHGISCLELQRIAVRILSQTSSSCGCEHYWSIHDEIRRQRHNRLAQKRLDELIYVHYNLRHRESHLKKRFGDSISLDSVLVELLFDDWIVEAEKQTLQEDEETFYDENRTSYEDESEDEPIGCEADTTVTKRGSLDLVTLVVEPPDERPANNAGTATDEDDDDEEEEEDALNYFDDDLSD